MVSLASSQPTLVNGVYQWNIQDTFTNSLGQKYTVVVAQWSYKQLADNGMANQLPQYAYLINTTAGGYTVVPANITLTFSGVPVVTSTSTSGTINYTNSGSTGDTAIATVRLLSSGGQSLGSVNVTFAVQSNGQFSYAVPAGLASGTTGILVASASVGTTVVSNAPQTSVTPTPTTGTIPPSNSTLYYVKYLYGGTTYEGIETLAYWVGNQNFTVSGNTYTNNATTTLQILASSGTLIPRVAVPGYVPPPDTAPITTFTATQVTIQAINGVQKTFTVKLTDWTAFQLSGGVPSSQVINLVNLQNQTSVPNTINDIGVFLAANATGGTTPPPPAPTPAPTNFQSSVTNGDIRLTWTSQYPVTLTVNGTLRVNNYAANAYSMFGQPNGTYTCTLFATNNGVNSSVVQLVATVNYTPPPPAQSMNNVYDIQYVASSNTPPLRLFTLVNYGTGTSISFPARSFVTSVLNITNNNIPTTLNAIVQPQVPVTSYPANETTIANYLNTYFAGPPVTTPKRDLMSYAKGILALGLTSSLLIGGGNKPIRKRKR